MEVMNTLKRNWAIEKNPFTNTKKFVQIIRLFQNKWFELFILHISKLTDKI